jgi:trans-aconitate methyltransferase
MAAMKLKEAWRRFSRAQVDTFLRSGHEGRDHPSRLTTLALLDGMASVLDVGCGTGVMYELVRERRPDLDYLGVDVTPQFVRAARERFPDAAQRFQEGSPLWLRRRRDEKLERGFYTHTYDLGRLVDHLLDGLEPRPVELRIHPRQGTSDPRFAWGGRPNVVYEVLRAAP